MNSLSPVRPLCAKDRVGRQPSTTVRDEKGLVALHNRPTTPQLLERKIVKVGLRTTIRRLAPLFALGAFLLPLRAQPSAADVLHHALHFADLYNWSDAAPEFSEAEKMFLAAGDQRNALFARLGKIRSTTEQRNLPATSAQLATELETSSILQTDKEVRMFCLIVKGDIDEELDPGTMRQDWQQVQALARDLGNTKWQYRSLAELGLAAFYDGDLTTARKNIASALQEAQANGDAGAQIRYLTVLGGALLRSAMYEQALPYFDNALKIASATPDVGYPFSTNEARLQTLIGLGRIDAAQHLADELLHNAQQERRTEHQAVALDLAADIARLRHDNRTAQSDLEQSIAISEATGFVRQLADAQALLADIYREQGNLIKAQQFATLAVDSTQASGDPLAVPQRLQTLAQIEISRGQYAEADRIYNRADAFIDSMIGNFSSVLEKTALITASSDTYSQHFALVAERFKDPARAYAIVEQVRGRIATDLLMDGSIASSEARKTERTVSQLRLSLMAARSTKDVRRIRDQIFMVEQSRWISPGISILKAQSHNTVSIGRVQRSLTPSAVILEYVVADPRSYCLVISRTSSRIVPLAGKRRIETIAAAYLQALKAKRPAHAEARLLFDVLLRPIPEAEHKENLVVIPDGRLHLVPFDALINTADHYIAEVHVVSYAPSGTAFYLLATQEPRLHRLAHTLLAVGGIPYNSSEVKQVSATRGYDVDKLSDLPWSRDEVLAAEAAVHDRSNTVLIGPSATESAFKRADLAQYRIIHLAVHGFASTRDPDRSALLFLSDPSAGEDGFLQASEIVQLRLNAALVILSACDTAVGPLEGEEGIATLSRAFLLAGARNVVSTLWSVDDTFSLFLMKHFYRHLATGEPPAYALAIAKRDMLQKFGRKAVPYYWAGYTFEGVAERAISSVRTGKRAPYVTNPK